MCVGRGPAPKYTSRSKQFTRQSIWQAAWCLRQALFNKSNLSRMDINPKRISQGDGSEQRMPKTWGGHLLSWGKSTREGGWVKKNNLYEALFDIILIEREAATRSVQRSHELWHDPLLVIFDEVVPELSFLGLLFFGILKCQYVCGCADQAYSGINNFN